MKTLLLHVPKFNNFYKATGDYIDIIHMPMGLVAMADLARQNKYDIEIIHLGIEYLLDKSFTLKEVLQDPALKCIGLSLHWHFQTYDVIEAIKHIKQYRPDIFVFVGGFTASYFGQDILETFPEVDGVIAGDGEAPLMALLEMIKTGGKPEKVPNLIWRGPGDVIVNNGISYTAGQEAIKKLDYTNFSLIRNHEHYIKSLSLPFFLGKNLPIEESAKRFTIGGPVFDLPIGRGCSVNCSWCSGSKVTQADCLTKRKEYLCFDHDHVIESIIKAKELGFKLVLSSVDSFAGSEEYFITLWERLKTEKIDIGWIYEADGIVTEKLVRTFRETFPGENSHFHFSPEHGNAGIRKKHKGKSFTNKQLFESLDILESHKVWTEIFYLLGLPGDTEKKVKATARLRKKIGQKYKYIINQRVCPLEFEPGSLFQRFPEKFNIVTTLKTFKDYYTFHSRSSTPGAKSDMGYYLPDFFDDPLDEKDPYGDFAKKIGNLMCSTFCSFSTNPWRYSANPEDGKKVCDEIAGITGSIPRDTSRPF